MNTLNELKHPAKYTDSFIHIFASILNGKNRVLDPFAGTGKLALIKEYGFDGIVVCNEIEPEWANSSKHNVDEWHIGDAQNMHWAMDNEFCAICTSPTYGNRMADHHNANDSSKRVTYRHTLGRPLNINNTGRMQWGNKYKKIHENAYKECYRVLKNDGIIVINISNHIRKGKEIDVVSWHKECLINTGFVFSNEIKVNTPRMGFGANSMLRVKNESILILTKN